MDVRYSHDGLHRLKKAEEGTAGSAGAFTVVGLVDDWTSNGKSGGNAGIGLGQTGNWLKRARDDAPSGLTGGNTTSTFNRVNELISTENSNVTISPQYSANGELTDDARRFSYKYDGWGRLTEVKNKATTPVVVAEYRYNALGYRTGWRNPVNADGTVDNGAPWYWMVCNECWQHIEHQTPKGLTCRSARVWTARANLVRPRHPSCPSARGPWHSSYQLARRQ